MSSVDSRIVTMQFDNSSFERGAAQSMSTMAKLKAAMSFENIGSSFTKIGSTIGGLFSKFTSLKNPFAPAQQGLTGLQQSANGFNTQSMVGGVTGVSKAFVAMSTVAITAIANVTNRMVNAGLSFAKSFTFSPIMDGLHEYETNLKSIQTVQANTDRPLKEVEASLEQLNKYSDQTIYNFSEMARNVGTFTAAGVDLETSVSSIKGIANLAALSGSSSQQAATAMYQLSQAISSGKVGLQDWNSVVNAGMGGKKLQNALAQTAIAMGDIDAASVKMVGPMKKLEINGQSFRESIMAKPGEQPWLSSDILVNTLATMDGRFSEAALAAEKTETGLQKYSKAQIQARIETARTNLEQKNGVKYTDEQFAALQKMSTAAFKSATEVKTLGQVFDIAKETLASGWSASFKNIFGNLKEAKTLFTGMSGGLNEIINANALARNQLLAAWNEGGGRSAVIEGLSNAWQGFYRIVESVHGAFRDIFPKTTSDNLIAMSKSFADFSKQLIPGKDTLDLIARTARGVFAVFSIGISIVKGIVGVIGDMFSALTAGEGSFLNITAGIGDFIVALDDAIKNGGLLEGFFSGLSTVAQIPMKVLANLGELLANLFTGLDSGAAGKAIDGMAQRFSPIEAAVERVRGVFNGFGQFVANAVGKAVEAFAGFGEALANSFTADTFGSALDALNTGLLAGIVLMLRNFFSGGMNVDVGGGLFGQIKETLGGVTDALQTMQTNLKANILLKIAGAVAILAASLLILSTIDPKALATALTGMAASFALITVMLGKLTTTIGIFGSMKLPFIAAGLMGIATAMLILSAAVKVMASMDLGTMLRGLTGIALMLLILSKAVVPLSANATGMVRAGAGLILVALALKVMASAVEDFAAIPLGDLAKGMLGIAAALLVLAGAMRLMPKGMVAQAAGLLILGGALKVIGSAIAQVGNLDMSTLVQGILGIAGALLVIAGAMALMPGPMLIVQATGLTILAGALIILGQAVAMMGGMSIETIAKGLGTLAASLVILAAGLYLMTGTLGGAAALVVAAAALALLVPILVTLGALSWETIIRGLTALAGVFLVIGTAGLLLAPVLPLLAGLAAVLLVLGAGLALVGAAALAFATAFGIVVAAGSAGVAVLSAILGKIISSIPKALKAFGQGIVAFAGAIAKGAPQFFRAFGAIINSLLRAAIQAIPKIGQLFMQLMTTALRVIVRLTPQIVNAGLRLIVQFLQAISRNVPKIVNIASDIIVKFLNGISRNLPRIIQSGVKLIISFVNGVAQAIRNNSDEMSNAGINLAGAIVEGMVKGIGNGISAVTSAAKNLAQSALNAAKNFLGIKSPSREFMRVGQYSSEGMAQGISTYSRVVDKAATDVGKSALTSLKAAMSGVSNVPGGNFDIRPTITPVLDLSEVQKNAGGIGDALAQNKMTADLSYRNASVVSSDLIAAANATTDSAPVAPVEVKVEQNNYSPEALSAVAIYRQTKGLVPLMEEALKSNGRD